MKTTTQLLAATIAAIASAEVRATDYWHNWKGSGTDWASADNWQWADGYPDDSEDNAQFLYWNMSETTSPATNVNTSSSSLSLAGLNVAGGDLEFIFDGTGSLSFTGLSMGAKNTDSTTSTTTSYAGKLKLSSGTYSFNAWSAIGRDGGEGTLTVSGATVSHTSSWLCLGNSAAGNLVVTSGTFTESGDGISVGQATGYAGTITISSGTFETKPILKIGENASGAMTVSGGYAYATNNVVNLGGSGVGTLTITNDGYMAIGDLYGNWGWKDFLYIANSSILNLDGGTLEIGAIRASGDGTINFNGGLLKAYYSGHAYDNTDGNGLITNANDNVSASLTLNVCAGGAKIYTPNQSGCTFGIAPVLAHDTTLGDTTDGGLVKTGEGTLELTAEPTFTGYVSVLEGTLRMPKQTSYTYQIDTLSTTVDDSGDVRVLTPATSQVGYMDLTTAVVTNTSSEVEVPSGATAVKVAITGTSGSVTLSTSLASSAVTVYATDENGQIASTTIASGALTYDTSTSGKIVVSLNESGAVDGVNVRPDVDTSASSPMSLTSSSVGLSVKTIAGLWYGMAQASDAASTSYTVQSESAQLGTGETLNLTTSIDTDATVMYYKAATAISKAALTIDTAE